MNEKKVHSEHWGRLVCTRGKKNSVWLSDNGWVVFTEAQFHFEGQQRESVPIPLMRQFLWQYNWPIWQIRSQSELQPGHICHHEWGYGKYVIWPPKEQLDNIQFRNKRALNRTDKLCSLILYSDWMSISQLYLYLLLFIRPALILLAIMRSSQRSRIWFEM